jgi:hypothetical protein
MSIKNVLLSIALLVFIYVVIFMSGPLPGEDVEVIEITEEGLGSLRIGLTKEEVIRLNSDNSFGAVEKPSECPRNWTKASELDDKYANCLLNAESWRVGHLEPVICPDRTDHHVTIYFDRNRLDRIKVRCTLAK